MKAPRARSRAAAARPRCRCRPRGPRSTRCARGRRRSRRGERRCVPARRSAPRSSSGRPVVATSSPRNQRAVPVAAMCSSTRSATRPSSPPGGAYQPERVSSPGRATITPAKTGKSGARVAARQLISVSQPSPVECDVPRSTIRRLAKGDERRRVADSQPQVGQVAMQARHRVRRKMPAQPGLGGVAEGRRDASSGHG